MRKLASIQIIDRIEKHDNADSLEIICVLGWRSIVRKGEFHAGDKVIYIEVDSFLPVKPEFSFLKDSLRKMDKGIEGYKIRTVRLRGVISQGLILPFSYLPKEYLATIGNSIVMPEKTLEVGDDVTEIMGIVQWQPPIPACLSGEVKGSFPSFIAKTDETRVQLLQPILDKYKGEMCYVTSKVDGSSATYYLKDGEFGVCSRNLELKETAGNAFWTFAREMKIEEKLRKFGKNIAIQGELIGLGLQGNPLKLKERKVLFFSAFDIDKFEYLNYDGFYGLIIYHLSLETVPVLNENYILNNNIPELVELATARSPLNRDVWQEGIVIRPKEEKIDLSMAQGFGNGRVSFKVINPEYLLVSE